MTSFKTKIIIYKIIINKTFKHTQHIFNTNSKVQAASEHIIFTAFPPDNLNHCSSLVAVHQDNQRMQFASENFGRVKLFTYLLTIMPEHEICTYIL